MKKMFLALLFIAFSGLMCAQANDGLTCENAIPVDSTYTGTIAAPGAYYFSAWTYDLPLTCYFYPEDENVSTLYLDIDFTCTPGVYDDPKVQELVDATLGWGIKLPMRFDVFEEGVDEYGRTYFSLSVDAIYRDLMATFGVSHNVQALVKVVTSSAGSVSMAPDTTFRSCVEKSIWLNLPDMVYTGVETADETFVMPLIDWANDSITFRWMGKEAPVQVWIGEDCDFNLSTTGENCAIDYFELKPDAGNGENVLDLSQQAIRDIVNTFGKGGIFYARILSSEKAGLAIERQAVEGPLAKAVKLDLDKSVAVRANDAEQVFYFPTEWKKRGLEFTSTIKTPIDVYVSKSIDFQATIDDPNVIGVYDFTTSGSGAYWQMSRNEMNSLCSNAKEEYVYVKFVSKSATSITPLRWNLCECVQESNDMPLNDKLSIKAKKSATIYRVHYDSWKGGDLTLTWSAFDNMKAYLVDTCSGFPLTSTNEHVLLYNEFKVNQGVDSLVITAGQMASFANEVDADGYLYFRFDAKSEGELFVKKVQNSSPVTPPSTPTTALLQLDSTIILTANHIDTTYHFTDDWEDISIEFVANTEDTTYITAYFATTKNIDLKAANYVAAYPFTIQENGSRLQLSAMQIRTILNSTKDGVVYVVFMADRNVQVTPTLWNACACATKSYEFAIEGTQPIEANTHDIVYRVNYKHWKDYDVSLHWDGKSTLWAYLAYTCDFNLTATNMYVLNSSDVDILANDTMVIGEEVREKAIGHSLLPEDGFLYFRCYTEDDGVVTPTFYPVNPDTSVDNVIVDKQRNRIICTPDGRIYILVGDDKYTILGEKL